MASAEKKCIEYQKCLLFNIDLSKHTKRNPKADILDPNLITQDIQCIPALEFCYSACLNLCLLICIFFKLYVVTILNHQTQG